MSIKSVLLSSRIRVGSAPASNKYEAGEDIRIDVKSPFVVIERREGGAIRAVGVPAVSVVSVEFEDVPTGGAEVDAEAKGRKKKGEA